MKIQSIIKDCPAELKENEKKIRTKRARMIKAARREQRESLEDVNEALRNYRGIDFRREEEEEQELQAEILEMERDTEGDYAWDDLGVPQELIDDNETEEKEEMPAPNTDTRTNARNAQEKAMADLFGI